MEDPSKDGEINWHEWDLGRNKKKSKNSNLDVTVILVSFYKEFFGFIVEIHKKY